MGVLPVRAWPAGCCQKAVLPKAGKKHFIENPSQRDSHYILNVCQCVCPSVHTCDILLLLHLSPLYDDPESRPYKPYIFWKLIIWWWQWPRRILTKRQRHTYTDNDKYKVLPRPNVCYIYQKQGVEGFKILYWLSSCDDKDKDKDKILCTIGAEYFSGVNIFQEWIFFRSEYFSEATIF